MIQKTALKPRLVQSKNRQQENKFRKVKTYRVFPMLILMVSINWKIWITLTKILTPRIRMNFTISSSL